MKQEMQMEQKARKFIEHLLSFKFRILFLALLILSSLVFCYQNFEVWKSSIKFIDQFHKLALRSNITSTEETNPLKILIWTTSFSSRGNFYTIDEEWNCPVKCEVTVDKGLIDQVDAVAVHATQESGSDMIFPAQRKMNQIRVFFRMESPQTPNYRKLPNHYNWTMTYRRDSDVPIFYANFRLKPNSDLSATEALKIAFHTDTIPAKKLDELKERFLPPKKNKLIAWSVSHCETESQRENLVAKLQQHLPVDIYGGCGSLKCKAKRMDPDWTSCYSDLGKEYKFYLAFENSLCIDYATEKLYTALKNGMVPIVYGGSNYGAIAPPGSYIEALAFPSVGELARYIKLLNERPKEYLKYFLWTEHYEFFQINWWCQLCKKLWSHSVVNEGGRRAIDPLYSRIQHNISSWWLQQPVSGPEISSCRPPPQFT